MQRVVLLWEGRGGEGRWVFVLRWNEALMVVIVEVVEFLPT